MDATSDFELRVLQAIRVRSIASTGDVATAAGCGLDEARALLASLGAAGLVSHHEGGLPGWVLTPDGRADGQRRVALDLDERGARGAVAEAYRSFRGLNHELLAACTDWQVRPGPDGPVVNDHHDAAHDDAAIARLVVVDTVVQPVLARLGDAVPRFSSYGPRLANALDRVHAGSRDWFDKPTIDSYHTIWFELHEDLLSTLGLDRASEKDEE